MLSAVRGSGADVAFDGAEAWGTSVVVAVRRPCPTTLLPPLKSSACRLDSTGAGMASVETIPELPAIELAVAIGGDVDSPA